MQVSRGLRPAVLPASLFSPCSCRSPLMRRGTSLPLDWHQPPHPSSPTFGLLPLGWCIRCFPTRCRSDPPSLGNQHHRCLALHPLGTSTPVAPCRCMPALFTLVGMAGTHFLLAACGLTRSTPTFSCLRCALLWLSASFGLLLPGDAHLIPVGTSIQLGAFCARSTAGGCSCCRCV